MLKSKNIIINKKVLLASFFAKTQKIIINIFLILSFNLVTLDFVNSKKLLKIIIAIFLKSFLILIDLFIVMITKKS